jgi:peptide/nickel transport system substrate-binding protein
VTRNNSSRRKLLRVMGAGAAISLAGCGGNQPDDTPAATDEPEDTDEDTATPTPEQTKTYTGGSLSLASPGPVQTLDPVNAKGSGAGYNQYQESLLNFPNGDLPAQPALAETVDISNDGLVYTIKLKEGVKFHDGQELTADDVVYSWERLAQSDNSRNKDDIIGSTFTIAHEGNTGESLENYEPGSLAVEAKSDYVFEFEMETAFHAVEDNIAGGAFGIIPEGSVGDIEGYDGEYDYQEFFSTAGDGPFFVGTGPFKVESWSKGDAITLSRFEDYHGEGPYIDDITYTNIPNSNTRWERFKNGNLDMVGGVPLSKFDPDARTIERDVGTYETGTYELPSGDTVEYGQSTPLDTDYLLFNTQRTPRPVRRAIAYLVNPQQISETIYKGLNPPAYHLSPPAVFPADSDEEPVDVYQRHAEEGYRSQTDFAADGYPYGMTEARLDQARTVMEEAGYGPDSPYEVEFTVFSGDPEWDSIAKRIRDKATNAHINISIVKADFGTIIGKALQGKMDMFSLGDGMEWPESDNFLRFLRPYDDPSGMFTRWTFEDKSKYTDLMEFAKETWGRYQENKGPSEDEQEIRDEVYLTMEEVNWESVQEFPLVHGSTQRFQQQRVNVRMAGTMENQKLNRLTLED